MPLKKSMWFVAAACISLTAVGSAARAAERSSIEPRAVRILKAAMGTISAAKSYMFRGEMTTEGALPGGQRLEYAGTVQGAVRRPDHAWIKVETEDGRRSDWYDGKTFTHLDLAANAYASWPAPPTINELFDKMKEKLGFLPPMAPLMRQHEREGSSQEPHERFLRRGGRRARQRVQPRGSFRRRASTGSSGSTTSCRWSGASSSPTRRCRGNRSTPSPSPTGISTRRSLIPSSRSIRRRARPGPSSKS